MDDRDVAQKAFVENRILITNDKDFGERIYRERQPHRGIVLLRLEDERAAIKIDVLRQLIASYADRLTDQYVVVTERECVLPVGSPLLSDFLLPRPFQIERQQPREDFVVRQIRRPAIGGEHGRVQRPVRQVEPRRPRVVEVGQRPLLESRASLAPAGFSHASRFATSSAAAAAMACTRGSSIGSRPGGQGKGKVSKVVVGV